jgi:imidazolonepropionase-like amidohydrolase
MRLIAAFFLVLIFSCSNDSKNANDDQVSNPSHYDLIITKSAVIDGTGGEVQFLTNVYVLEGKIARVEKGYITESADEIIDGTGKFLIPAITDANKFDIDYLMQLAADGTYPIQVIKQATLDIAGIRADSTALGTISTGNAANMTLLNNSPLSDFSTLEDVFCIISNGMAKYPAQE